MGLDGAHEGEAEDRAQQKPAVQVVHAGCKPPSEREAGGFIEREVRPLADDEVEKFLEDLMEVRSWVYMVGWRSRAGTPIGASTRNLVTISSDGG